MAKNQDGRETSNQKTGTGRSRDLHSTASGVFQVNAQTLDVLLQIAQETPGLHASHIAQAVTAELTRLLVAVDANAVVGEKQKKSRQESAASTNQKISDERSPIW